MIFGLTRADSDCQVAYLAVFGTSRSAIQIRSGCVVRPPDCEVGLDLAGSPLHNRHQRDHRVGGVRLSPPATTLGLVRLDHTQVADVMLHTVAYHVAGTGKVPGPSAPLRGQRSTVRSCQQRDGTNTAHGLFSRSSTRVGRCGRTAARPGCRPSTPLDDKPVSDRPNESTTLMHMNPIGIVPPRCLANQSLPGLGILTR